MPVSGVYLFQGADSDSVRFYDSVFQSTYKIYRVKKYADSDLIRNNITNLSSCTDL
jgi:hypothetical protein